MLWNKLRILMQISRQPWKLLISRVLWRTGVCRLLIIQRNGYRLRFFPSAVSANLWFDAHDLTGDECFLASFLRPGQIVVDVGANVGTISIFSALQVGESGRVYALEAHPATARYLRANVRLNGLNPIVQVINCAVGDAVGELSFSDIRSDDQNCVANDSKAGIRVEVNTLDSLIQEKSIDLLKIDVEGYELMVLRGATDVLSRTRAVYFEAWDRHFNRYGYRFSAVWDFLYERGFRVADWRTGASVPRGQTISQCVNLLAIRDV
jgi:FkbM family methyltransferase